MDSIWTDEIKQDFRTWAKNNQNDLPMSLEALDKYLESRNFLISIKVSLKKELILLIFLPVVGLSQQKTGTYDPYHYGAKGDGKTLDTKAIQAAIEDCNRVGGGRVYLYGGKFKSGTITLKSNVILHIEAGAELIASDNLDHFPSLPSKHPAYTGEYETLKAFIYAEDENKIAIQGPGTINGNGDQWVKGPYGFPSFSKRPRIIHFRGCNDIIVRDVTLYNAASWVQSYQSCKNIIIDGITVDSRENKDIEQPRYHDVPGRNTDGLDLVDCQQVRISNCNINSGDDAICLKSFSPTEACRDVVISNCIVSSNASGIKIGTETSGTFEDITIQNCVVFDTRVDAISIMTADGAKVNRVNISDISVRNIKGSAIFIRLGNRNRTYRKDAVVNEPVLKNVMIENVQGTRISSEHGCIIAGIPGYPVENIQLRNINLLYEGGGTAEDSFREIPEKEQAYPNGLIFGKLPAYGFYIRHAKNIILDNVQMRFTEQDQRPALICEDVDQLKILNLMAEAANKTPELIRLINTENVVVEGCQPLSPVNNFLSIAGDSSKNISLINNLLRDVKQKAILEKESMKTIYKEYNNIEN